MVSTSSITGTIQFGRVTVIVDSLYHQWLSLYYSVPRQQYLYQYSVGPAITVLLCTSMYLSPTVTVPGAAQSASVIVTIINSAEEQSNTHTQSVPDSNELVYDLESSSL